MTKANELTDAKINYISLVKRGANGDPLRVLKADDTGDGIDLAGVNAALTSVAKSDPQAVFFSATDDVLASVLEQAIVALGYKNDTVLDTENGTVFMQANRVPADVMMFELAPGIHMGMSGVGIKKADLYAYACGVPQRDGISAASFDEVMGTQGAIPMLSAAMDALGTVLRTAVQNAKTGADAKSAADTALQDCSSFIGRIIEMIPLNAFKAEVAVDDALIAAAEAGVQAEADAEAEDQAGGDTDALGAPVTAHEETPAAVETPAAPAAETPAVETPAAPAEIAAAKQGAGAVDTDAITKTVTEAVFKGLKDLLDPISKSVSDVATRVEKTEVALQSTTVGGRGVDERTRTAKQQPVNGSDDFSFDTGMGRPLQ